MIQAVRRPLLALVVAAVVIGGWLGAPLLAAPVGRTTTMAPEQTAPTGGVGASGSRAGPASPEPTTASATASGPASSPALGSPRPTPVGTGVPGRTRPSSIPHHGITTATPMLRAALDARLERLRAKAGIPGISVAILFPDGTTWQGTAGLADVAAARPVTTDTAFPVASVSKTFTAALILGLVEDGKLSLDSTAKTYLPTLAIDPAMTVRELLDHTSGLRDFYFGAGIDKALLTSPTRVWDAARSLSYVGKPYARPGVSWHYSNTNYLILGLVAEVVGGAPVAGQLRDRFFTPLGLDHTYYQAVETPRGPVVHSYRFTGPATTLPAIDLSDGTSVVPFTSVVTAAAAAGSIATSADDLAHWARALYGGEALAPAMRDAMVDDVLRTAQFKPAIAYGLGVQAVTVDGHAALGHSGRFLGARAVVRWLPAERIAIAVLTNQSRSDPNAVLTDLLKLALQPQPDCTSCAILP